MALGLVGSTVRRRFVCSEIYEEAEWVSIQWDAAFRNDLPRSGTSI